MGNTVLKQIVSHYQAVGKPTLPPFDIGISLDIEEVTGIIYEKIPSHIKIENIIAGLNEKFKYFIVEKEVPEFNETEAIGLLRFTRQDELLPTALPNHIGVEISVKGKTFICYYDENNHLNIGHNGGLYCFSESQSWGDDFQEVYWFVFEHIVPNEEDI